MSTPTDRVSSVPAESGDALQRAVEVMDRLRSPGGCPWDAAQTHASLAKYLLEETYETLEAIDAGDSGLLREELGDLLLQVLFHARLAEELPSAQRFGIEEVAGDLVAKLVRRHPHVFADVSVAGADEVESNWDEIKRVEKGRTSAVDGVPMALPALALTAKLISRSRRAGVQAALPEGSGFGEQLFALAAEAVAAGVDPEEELRAVTRRYRDAITAAERNARAEPFS